MRPNRAFAVAASLTCILSCNTGPSMDSVNAESVSASYENVSNVDWTGLEAKEPRIVKAMRWLPVNTETLIVVTEPGQYSSMSEDRMLADSLSNLTAFGFPTSDSSLAELIAHQFIVHGTRAYQPPHDLGMWSFEGCTIVAPSADSRKRLESALEEMDAAKEMVAGRNVSVVHVKDRNRNETWYLVFEDDLVFSATDRGYLEEVLNRKDVTPTDRALPDNLEHWRHINPTDPFWAVRRFSLASNMAPGGANMGDEQLVGYAMFLSSDRKALTIMSISNNPEGAKFARRFEEFLDREQWPHEVTTEQIDLRTTKIVLDATGDSALTPMFLLLAAVGHAIYV